MSKRFSEAEVVSIRDLSPSVKSFLLRAADPLKLDFMPGQFITLDLPVGTKRLDRWRSYSLANAPGASTHLELCVVKMEGGKGTNYLFNELRPGDKLSFKGPEGSFVLPKDLSKEIVLICTGTGIAPFKSMIDFLMDQKMDFKSIHLIFGTRTEEDVLYREQLEAYTVKDDRFRYSVCLSREPRKDDWPDHFNHGYVHKVYEDLYRDGEASRLFMLCGWSQMIDEAVVRLHQMGYSDQQIMFELYG